MVVLVEMSIDARSWGKGFQKGFLGPEPRNKILSPSPSGDIEAQ